MSTSLITWVPKVDETMIAFDPSLANTGWVLVRMGRAIDQGVIKTPPSDTGIRGNLERSETIYSEVAFLLKTYVPVYVACELPAVQGYRIDAALLSSQAIYLASAHTLNVVPRLINSQHVKKRITGNARASKG
jgi:Holliday junction resolvasome RuvABC endonuclease subunit